ncbi:hypothetical protein FACS18949_09430 [Clostridia bacterium]|nr:hypothetical protein FACS18949_09430 [Clostridia bacterium]
MDTERRERYHELMTGEFRDIYEEELARLTAAPAARPAENGVTNRGGSAVRAGASRLSAKERAELAKRAAQGERITL